MTDPNRHVPSYQGPMQTYESIPDESFDYDFPEDHLTGENAMLNENVNQFDHPTGENVMLTENVNQFGHGTSQEGPSCGVNDQSNEHLISGNFNQENLICGKPVQLFQWPVPPEPYTCSNCQVLREIIHTKVGETSKFEIHGRLGMIFHGILEIRRGDVTAPNIEHKMFDFSKVPIPDVKKFLLEYCEERTEASCTLVKDPFFAFSEALSVGSDWDFGLDIDEILRGSPPPPPPPPPADIGENVEQQPEATNQPDVSEPQAEGSRRRSKKRKRHKVKSKSRYNYKDQRNVCKGLAVKDFVDYFTLTIEDAAEKVGICSTSFKNILQKEKFSWPRSKIRKAQKNIANRSKDLDAADPQKRASAEADIKKSEEEIESIYAPFKKI